MDKKERVIQTALGEMKRFKITAIIPIKGEGQIEKEVMGVNKKDAIANMKTILSLESPISIAKQACANKNNPSFINMQKVVINGSEEDYTFYTYECGNITDIDQCDKCATGSSQ